MYVSHGNQVDVLDADSNEVKGTIPNTNGVHGIALAPDLGRGFTSNGRDDNVTTNRRYEGCRPRVRQSVAKL